MYKTNEYIKIGGVVHGGPSAADPDAGAADEPELTEEESTLSKLLYIEISDDYSLKLSGEERPDSLPPQISIAPVVVSTYITNSKTTLEILNTPTNIDGLRT